jgi:hypothetical protein
MQSRVDDLLNTEPYVRSPDGAWVTDDIPHATPIRPGSDAWTADEPRSSIVDEWNLERPKHRPAAAAVDAATAAADPAPRRAVVARPVVAVPARSMRTTQRPTQSGAGTQRQMGGVPHTNRFFVRRQFG